MSSVGLRVVRRSELRFDVQLLVMLLAASQLTILSVTAVAQSRVNTRDICQRDPPDIAVDSLAGDRGFRIQILGHASRYAPGQVYTVVINGSYPNQRLAGFMLVAVPLNAKDETTTMGTFQHIDTSSTRFDPNCPHVVREVNRRQKSFVEVLWTAPSSGAGCVEFRATVIERGQVWVRDDGALTRVFCQDTRTTEGERPSEMVPDCCACGTAKYQLTFQGKWSQATHPKDYPTQRRLLHWSNIVGASHSRNYFVWQYGAYATRGVKEVCELGYPRTVEEEIQQRSREVRSLIKTTGIWWSEPHGIDQSRTARFSTDRRRHLMSLLTMIGPSPDWCVGVSGLDLCLPNCTWAGDMTIDLYPWDAGTDDGITYMSPNAKSDPQQKIHRITNQFPDDPQSPFHGRDSIRPLATLHIRRLNAPTTAPSTAAAGNEPERGGSDGDTFQCTDNSDTEDVLESTDTSAAGLTDMEKQKLMMMQQQDGGKCAVSPWDDWSGCSVTCGVGLRVRKRAYLNPMVDESMCGLPLMESENCIGLENECETVDEDCAMTAWSSWSPCSATCEKGTRQRLRYYLNKEDMLRCNREAEEIEMCVAEIMDCEKARAMAQSAEVCSLPVSVGPCRGNFRRWYYDTQSRRCTEFSYGGCRGNRNQFGSLEECERVCDSRVDHLGTTATIATTTTTTNTAVLNAAQICSLPRDPGPCHEVIDKWYFDTAMGKCLPFVFGGCRGNLNQFSTDEECVHTCILGLNSDSQRHLANEVITRASTATTPAARSPERRPNGNAGVARITGSSNATTVHCSVSTWSSWSACPVTCATATNRGTRTRQRQIRRSPANGGRPCPQQLEQRKKCDGLPPCPTVSPTGCVMSPWSEWSPCSKTCGSDAVQERESHLIPTGTRNSTVPCFGPVRLLRRICSQLPPCANARLTTAATASRRVRSQHLV